MKKNIWYFPLEILKERYTGQLSNSWIPATFANYKDINFNVVEGDLTVGNSINTGVVLDAIGRGKFALKQCANFLDKIAAGEVKNGDVIFLQEFWTAGVESIFYALDLYNIKVQIYSTIWAQSVDCYDFTYKMRDWMRYFELGLDKRLSGIFVASTIHKEELKAAGFNAPIHVVSLTVHTELVKQLIGFDSKYPLLKEPKVIYTSRYDWEKNPMFMIAVAKEFLKYNQGWIWVCTTSAKEFRSNDSNIIKALYAFAEKEPRFQLKCNLTKEQYYRELSTARIQFNSALQDYVSFTGVEAAIFNCNMIYPDFRSFKEMLPQELRYMPFNVEDAVEKIDLARQYHTDGQTYIQNIIETSDLGRELMCNIIVNGAPREYNIWHEKELIKTILSNE